MLNPRFSQPTDPYEVCLATMGSAFRIFLCQKQMVILFPPMVGIRDWRERRMLKTVLVVDSENQKRSRKL